MFFDDVNHFCMFQVIELFRHLSLNILLSSSSRLNPASKEWLKVRFHQKNKEISTLECRNLFSKKWIEKPLIQRSIGSFQARFWVRLCVFLLIFHYISLDFNFKA